MSKIKKLFVPFDAIQWDGTDETADLIYDWTGKYHIISMVDAKYHFITIYTIEEPIEEPISAMVGDWIVKDIADNFHVLHVNAVPNDN